MKSAVKAIEKNNGQAIPTIKPWNMELVEDKMNMVKDVNPVAIAMDIDAAGLPFLKNLQPPAGSKNVQELKDRKSVV